MPQTAICEYSNTGTGSGRWQPYATTTYGYDQIGNITTKNGQAYSYSDPAHVHAVTGYMGTAYSYDANGSLVGRGTQAIRYDPELRPVRLKVGGSVLWRAAYDRGRGQAQAAGRKGDRPLPGGL